MHRQRWVSGLIIAPALILFILYAPPWLFLLLIFLLTFLGLREFYALSLPGLSPKKKNLALLLGFLIPLSLYSPEPRCFLGGLLTAFFSLSLLALGEQDDFPSRVDRVSRHLLGFIYVPFLLAHFVLMHQLVGGRVWILFTLVAVYFGDTTAFYIGRAWGRRKLAPAISPRKTLEGGLGAVGGSVAGALFYQLLFFPQLPFFHALILGLGVGVGGQVGDLFESLLKRSAQVKDSGSLIPGHGGLLDRIDSVLFAGPLVYYYAWAIGNLK